MLTVHIQAKLLGTRKPIIASEPLEITGEWGSSGNQSLKNFIEKVVTQEVISFKKRQTERSFLSILSPEQIQEGLATGKLISGKQTIHQEVDIQSAIQTALTAFEDGLYFVFINDEQVTDLESVIDLDSSSKALFLRLVPLAGG